MGRLDQATYSSSSTVNTEGNLPRAASTVKLQKHFFCAQQPVRSQLASLIQVQQTNGSGSVTCAPLHWQACCLPKRCPPVSSRPITACGLQHHMGMHCSTSEHPSSRGAKKEPSGSRPPATNKQTARYATRRDSVMPCCAL